MRESQSHRELREIVARVENIDDQLAGLRADRRDVLAEAKARGFDTPTIRKVVARRHMLPSERAEADILVATYEEALAGWPRGVIDGGDLTAQPALPAPAAQLSKKDMARAELEAWMRGDIGNTNPGGVDQ